MDIINNVKTILKEEKLWPNKMLGQNFLVGEDVLHKIVQIANIKSSDVVLEIGPGLGILTEELAKRAKLVLAVEKDRKLVEYLREKFKHCENVKIICDDILQYHGLTQEQLADYKIVANVPYNITSPIINKFVTEKFSPKSMTLMIQKEVAQRLTAQPGDSDRGFMTILVEYYANATYELFVPRTSFYPAPDVDSAVINIKTKATNPNIDGRQFLKFVKMGFSQKRRQLHHPISSGLHLSKEQTMDLLKTVKIDPVSRAEQLSLSDWLNLYAHVQNHIVN